MGAPRPADRSGARRAAARCALALALALGACQARPSAVEGCPPESTEPVDPPLLAFLSRARAAHHAADAHAVGGDAAAAIRVLTALVEGPRPAGDRIEAREVLADARARLADLESARGQFAPALEHVTQGLALARETTYFRGHLLETRGHVEERQAAASADPEAARAARQRAITAFEEAMAVQGRVIECGLGRAP